MKWVLQIDVATFTAQLGKLNSLFGEMDKSTPLAKTHLFARGSYVTTIATSYILFRTLSLSWD